MPDGNHLTCELIRFFSFLGKKWVVVIFHQLDSVPMTFNQLCRVTRNRINRTHLSGILRQLIKFKLVEKTIHDGKKAYTLSEQGIRFRSILHDVKPFAIENDYKIPSLCKNGRCKCSEIFRRF